MVREYTLQNPLGLHARPATLLAKTVQRFNSTVTVEKGGKTVNAGNVWDLLLLAAEQGHVLVVRVEGEDAEAAVAALDELFAENFGES